MANDGRMAVDVLVSDFVEKTVDEGAARWGFPPEKAGTPIEPHRNHQLMTLLRAGVALDRTFSSRNGRLTLRDLVESARRRLAFAPGDAFYRTEAWTLDALAAITPESTPRFAAAGGKELDLSVILDGAVGYLSEQHRFLDDARRRGEPKVEKRKQFIWGHPCGGFHLFQASFSWMDQEGFRKRHASSLALQIDVLLFRLEAETQVYDDALRRAPDYALQLETQRLKFYGHFLETVGRLQKLKAWGKTPARRAAVGRARDQLASAVRGLRTLRAMERMPELRTTLPQVYLDLIGDSCHAVTGLRTAN
jgi:hypothetical protein